MFILKTVCPTCVETLYLAGWQSVTGCVCCPNVPEKYRIARNFGGQNFGGFAKNRFWRLIFWRIDAKAHTRPCISDFGG